MNLESQIESILFFRNEPVTLTELSKLLGQEKKEVGDAIKSLQEFYRERGIVVVSDGESVSFGTSPNHSALIEKLQKEEFSRELGRAGLETLAIILYKGPVSRREIDHIRGVNSTFTLRALMVRGLIERVESISGERSYSYKPTLELYKHLGITKKEDLPEYADFLSKVENFIKTHKEAEDESD